MSKQKSSGHTFILGTDFIDDQPSLAASTMGEEQIPDALDLRNQVVGELAQKGYQFFVPLKVTEEDAKEYDANKAKILETASQIIKNLKEIKAHQTQIDGLVEMIALRGKAVNELEGLEFANKEAVAEQNKKLGVLEQTKRALEVHLIPVSKVTGGLQDDLRSAVDEFNSATKNSTQQLQAKSRVAKLLEIKLPKKTRLADEAMQSLSAFYKATVAHELAKEKLGQAHQDLHARRNAFKSETSYDGSLKVLDLREAIKEDKKSAVALNKKVVELKDENTKSEKEKNDLILKVRSHHDAMKRQDNKIGELEAIVKDAGGELEFVSEKDLKENGGPKVIFARNIAEVKSAKGLSVKQVGKNNTDVLLFTDHPTEASNKGVGNNSIVDLQAVDSEKFMANFNTRLLSIIERAMIGKEGKEIEDIQSLPGNVARMVNSYNARLASEYRIHVKATYAGGLFAQFKRHEDDKSTLMSSTFLSAFKPDGLGVSCRIEGEQVKCVLTDKNVELLQQYLDQKCQGSLPGGFGKVFRAHTTDSYAIGIV